MTETFTQKEVEALRAHGFEVEVRTMRGERQVDPRRGVLRALPHLASPRRALAAARGAALARELDPARDHVHAQFPLEAASAGLFAAGESGATFSFSIHTLHEPPLIEEKLRAASFVVAGSEFERDEVGRRYGAEARAKVEVRRLGVLRREARDGYEPGLVVSVGTLAGKKGHDVLIRAVARLERPVRLVIVGEGPERPALEALADELGVDAELPGTMPHEQALALTARAEVFALCCRRTADGDHDFLPVALMDAMSLGVPCVSTRFVGIPELIEDGVSGLLAEPGDPASAAEKLARAFDEQTLGAAGLERVRSDYDLDRNTAKLADLFRARLS